MKKLFFSVALLFAFAMVFAQITPDIAGTKQTIQERQARIWKVIQMSKEVNLEHGIKNPDLILPGQSLTFLFEDGKKVTLTVEPGDNQWKVIKSKLDYWEKIHGSVVPYPVKPVQPDTIKDVVPTPVNPKPNNSDSESWSWWDPAQGLFIIFIGFLVLISALYLLIKKMMKEYKARRENPVTAGPPQVQGGVEDKGAHNRMRQVAESRYPGARIEIKNIRRGWLSGLAKVFYAGGKTRKLKLRDVPAYAGEARINGRDETIYFLQGCGNDARAGNYMTGNLEFRPDVNVGADGTTTPIPEEETPPLTVAEEPSNPPVQNPNPGTEFHQHVGEVMKLAEKVITAKDAFKVNFQITHESFNLSIENRIDKKGKPNTENK